MVARVGRIKSQLHITWGTLKPLKHKHNEESLEEGGLSHKSQKRYLSLVGYRVTLNPRFTGEEVGVAAETVAGLSSLYLLSL